MSATKKVTCRCTNVIDVGPLSYVAICDSCGRWTCTRCGFDWKPRIDNPRYCPACKRYIQETKETLESRARKAQERARKAREEREQSMLTVQRVSETSGEEFLCFTHFSQGQQQPAIVRVGKHYYCKECAVEAMEKYVESLAEKEDENETNSQSPE